MKLCRCKHTLWIRRHKIVKIKGYGYRCAYCFKTKRELDAEARKKKRAFK